MFRAMSKVIRACLLIMLVATLPAPISALAGGSDALRRGLEYYDSLEYEEALPLLERAMKDEGLESSLRAQAGLHAAIIKISLGEVESAREIIGRVVLLSPDVELPDSASPQIMNLLDDARAALPPPTTEAREQGMLIHVPPSPGQDSAPAVVRLGAEAPEALERIVLQYRQLGTATWLDLDARRVDPTRFEARLPAPSPESGAVEYYFEGFDRAGARVAQVGSGATPLLYLLPEGLARPPTKEAPPLYTRWWFWTGAGAVGLSAVGLAVALSQGGECTPGEPNKGCLSLEVR